MKFELASKENSKELCEFYKNFPIHWNAEFHIDRKDNFFLPYEITSDSYQTYLIKEEDSIEGTASFCNYAALIDDKVTNISIGKDLRVSSHRKAILEWGVHFLPTMQKLKDQYNIEHFFSILNLTEVKALNTFVKNRQLKRPLPRYHLYRRFYLVSIHGRLPFVKNPLPHLRIQKGSDRNAEVLIDYIIKKSLERNLSTIWDQESFFKKLGRYPGLKLEDFFVAFDQNNNVIGCLAPWSAKGIQEYIPYSYDTLGHNFRQFLKFGKLFGWTRSLTKPLYRTLKQESLSFHYLTFLNVDNEYIFESLIWKAFESVPKTDFLVYSHMRPDIFLRKPPGWISAEIPFGLYYLLAPEQQPPSFLHPTHDQSAEIEPFLV